MGGLCKSDVQSTPTSQTVVQGTQLPEWVSKGGQELFGQAKALAERPFDVYEGQRVAGLSPLEQSAYTTAEPVYQESIGLARQGAQQWSPDVSAQYMNPFTQNVIDTTVQRMGEQFDQQNLRANDAAARAGAFGGARHGVLESQNALNQNRALGETVASMNQQAYEAARQGFQADRAASGAAAQNLANLGTTQATMAGQQGALERGVNQQNLDVAYQDFQNQQRWPYEQLNFALGALQGVPYNQNTTSATSGQQITQGASPLGQGLGALGALYGGYKLFG